MSKEEKYLNIKGGKATTNDLDWFELAFGFKENPEILYRRDNEYLKVDYNGYDIPLNEKEESLSDMIKTCPTLTCKKTGEIFQSGFFSTPTLNELRERNTKYLASDTNFTTSSLLGFSSLGSKCKKRLKLSIEINDAAALHRNYPFATIHVATQFKFPIQHKHH